MTLVGNVFAVLAESVKTVYFTSLYMLIQHPDRINPELAPKLIEFVEMKSHAQENQNNIITS